MVGLSGWTVFEANMLVRLFSIASGATCRFETQVRTKVMDWIYTLGLLSFVNRSFYALSLSFVLR
jgi:hypothetical protein